MKESRIRKIIRKAVVECVLGMGERKWGSDFRRRQGKFKKNI
jgi:hypothetical protein